MKIQTTDPSGASKSYRIKPLDDMTLGEWVTMTQPDPTLEGVEAYEQLLHLVARHTTLPRKVLNKMPAVEVTKLVDAMVGTLDDIAKAREAAERAAPKSFAFDDVTYMVPQSIEAELTFGQWESLTKVMIPQCTSDAESYAAVIAATCMPEGEEFDGAKMAQRKALFMGLPLRTAFDVSAFFFDNSEQLRSVISRIGKDAQRSLLLKVEQALTSSSTSTVPT